MIGLDELLEAEKQAKETKENYDTLVAEYIKINVDPDSWASIDEAICELPESKNKLVLYDMMYELENGN